MNDPAKLILSCEHGGNDVPLDYRSHLDSPLARQHLRSHRGWDPGALEAATFFAKESGESLLFSTTTRLLVDLNRSVGNPQLFSRFTAVMTEADRDRVLQRHYHPYRQQVHQRLQATVDERHCAVHVSVHTFTPRMRGTRRTVDIGLLFDPGRTVESNLCIAWQQILRSAEPRLRVELNQPYLGIDDGLTTAMRTRFSDRQYAGIELEINNRIRRRTEQGRQKVFKALYDSLAQAVDHARMTLTPRRGTNSKDALPTLS